MRSTAIRVFLAFLAVALAPLARAQDETGGGNGDGATAAGTLPGFVDVPAGTIHPGCDMKSFKARATNPVLRRNLIYDVWSSDIKPLRLDRYSIGRYEITNAQWKYYLDANFKVEHVTSGAETLEAIAEHYVKWRGKGVTSQWRPIYAFNHQTIYSALVKAEKWDPQRQGWKIANPKPGKEPAVEVILLPKGLKLSFYRHPVPSHWYGWCRLSHLSTGREYCDITKPPAEAFTVPTGETMFDDPQQVKPLRAKDFAAYPVRDISPAEALDFAEWAGCHLPSEYEWERAARADRPNSGRQTFPGEWDRSLDKRIFAWVDNPACRSGPLPADDESVARGDSPFGARHMLGNVWELCRTLYDYHPRVVPKPPPHPEGLFNYALTAKGGAWGSGWIFIQISTRTGSVGNGDLGLRYSNHLDSLGLRVVRHPRPGHDLLLHSIRRIAFNSGSGQWNDPLPHAYSLPRMAGADVVEFKDSKSPYIHLTKKAYGIAFAPVWLTPLNESIRKKKTRIWRAGNAAGRGYSVLGVLRSDVPLRAGVRMTTQGAADLLKQRVEYKRREEEIERWSKKKKRRKPRKKKRDGEEETEPTLPPKPPEPDAYERATRRNEKGVGLWRESTVPPGEWVVVYWYGFLGLANKTGLLDAIILIDKTAKAKSIQRKREGRNDMVQNTQMTLDRTTDTIHLKFWVEEQADPKKPDLPPDVAESEIWALCEVHPDGWPGRRKGKYFYMFDVKIPVEKGGLAKHDWKTAPPK